LSGGIAISTIKLSIVIMALGLLCFMGTAMASPHHGDWLSPGGEFSVWHSGSHYSSWHYPSSWYYSTPTYHYSWYTPVYYNSYDPWWFSNVYGPYTTTYYYWGW